MPLLRYGCHTFIHTHPHTHTYTQSPGPVIARKLTAGVAIATVTMSCTPKYSLQGLTPYFCCMAVCESALMND